MKEMIGKHIREIRKKAGFKTIETLAEALGVHPNSVGELERGDNWISPEMLQKLVDVLKQPPAAFFPGYNEIPGNAKTALKVLADTFTRLGITDTEMEMGDLVTGYDGKPFKLTWQTIDPSPANSGTKEPGASWEFEEKLPGFAADLKAADDSRIAHCDQVLAEIIKTETGRSVLYVELQEMRDRINKIIEERHQIQAEKDAKSKKSRA